MILNTVAVELQANDYEPQFLEVTNDQSLEITRNFNVRGVFVNICAKSWFVPNDFDLQLIDAEVIKELDLVQIDDYTTCYATHLRAFRQLKIEVKENKQLTVIIFREVWEPTWGFITLMALVMLLIIIVPFFALKEQNVEYTQKSEFIDDTIDSQAPDYATIEMADPYVPAQQNTRNVIRKTRSLDSQNINIQKTHAKQNQHVNPNVIEIRKKKKGPAICELIKATVYFIFHWSTIASYIYYAIHMQFYIEETRPLMIVFIVLPHLLQLFGLLLTCFSMCSHIQHTNDPKRKILCSLIHQ